MAEKAKAVKKIKAPVIKAKVDPKIRKKAYFERLTGYLQVRVCPFSR